MKVKDLVAKLLEQDQEADVFSIAAGDDGYYQLHRTSGEVYVGPIPHTRVENAKDLVGVMVCGAETLIAHSDFGEGLEQSDRKRIFDGWSVALGTEEEYHASGEPCAFDYPMYRHYPMIQGAKGGPQYFDCCFERLHDTFAGEN